MQALADFVHAFLLWPGLILLACAAAFVTIERLWPARPRQRAWRQGSTADLLLSFANPIVVTPLTSLAITGLVNLFLARTGYAYLDAARDRLDAWPFAAQLLAALLLADLCAYWKHRLFHARWLWPIHAVHHSAEEIDWLTNERDHPLQLLATHVLIVVPLVLAGFGAEVIALQATLRRVYSLFTHANVRCSYGALDRVFVSPAVHRWHHARDAGAAGGNFAVFFSFYDVLFGTYRLPAGAPQPDAFGLPDQAALPDVWAMLRYPFQRRARSR